MMGFGKFWIRFIILLLGGIIIWQLLLKNWSNPTDETSTTSELQVNENKVGANDVEVQKVHIVVYYEALCPDSKGFIIKQLQPTYQKLSDNVIIEMIPYGHATTKKDSTGYTFQCQHGPHECEANTIHACSIDTITNPTVQLNFIACMIENNRKPVEITKTCAEKFHVNVDNILKCAQSDKGPTLLAKYGEMTNALISADTFIPTITLDKKLEDQSKILMNLLHEVCEHFKVKPSGCN